MAEIPAEAKIEATHDINRALEAGWKGLDIAIEGSFAQFGIKPQRIVETWRTGCFGCCRMTRTGWVGAIL